MDLRQVWIQQSVAEIGRVEVIATIILKIHYEIRQGFIYLNLITRRQKIFVVVSVYEPCLW